MDTINVHYVIICYNISNRVFNSSLNLLKLLNSRNIKILTHYQHISNVLLYKSKMFNIGCIEYDFCETDDEDDYCYYKYLDYSWKYDNIDV